MLDLAFMCWKLIGTHCHLKLPLSKDNPKAGLCISRPWLTTCNAGRFEKFLGHVGGILFIEENLERKRQALYVEQSAQMTSNEQSVALW